MSDIAISVENVSKMYRLGSYGTNTLGDDITRSWAKVRGKEDPFAKIAEANDRSKKMESDYVWSLKDVSFDVKKGESLGILGRNGAGKSTLLKILSRITTPSAGNIKVDGRIASLLEVGTGFNPDLTGRENAYMNGAILGMNRKEVASKLDQIIDFSGVEGYIDTPVKRYSSGMYVRLAFSVAAHLNTEILILDEVLSVGDMEFQRKCANKIDSICKKEGKTIIFVSHALATIEKLCSKVIYLKSGELIHVGATEDIVPFYKEALRIVELENEAKEKADRIARGEEVEEEEVVEEEIIEEVGPKYYPNSFYENNPDVKIQIRNVELKNSKGELATSFSMMEDVELEIEYEVRKSDLKKSVLIAMVYRNDVCIFRTDDVDLDEGLLEMREKGLYNAKFLLPRLLKAGDYKIDLITGILRLDTFEHLKNVVSFQVTEDGIDTTNKSYADFRHGLIITNIEWLTQKIPKLSL